MSPDVADDVGELKRRAQRLRVVAAGLVAVGKDAGRQSAHDARHAMAQQDKNRDKRLQDQDRAAADADKRRKELENQFNTDITSVREMLAQTTDPQRREAIMRSLQVMKSAYTGASARQAGCGEFFVSLFLSFFIYFCFVLFFVLFL